MVPRGNGIRWIDQYDGGPHEAGFLKLDCSRIRNVFGWQPRLDVRQAVEWTVEWTRAWLGGEEMEKVMDRQIQRFFKTEDGV